MRGYLHFPAMATAVGTLTVLLDHILLLIFFFLWLGYLHLFRRLGILPMLISVLCSIFTLYYIPTLDQADTVNPPSHEHPLQLEGSIVSPPDRSSERINFTFQDDASQKNILVTHFLNDASDEEKLKDISHGASCRIRGLPERPDIATNPGQFDYRRYLQTKDVSYQMILESPEDISCQGNSALHHLYALRSTLLDHTDHTLSPVSSSWMAALIFGDDSGIDDDIMEIFRDWSLSHLLAISGLHVGLVIAVIYFICVKCGVLTKEKTNMFLMLFLPVYAVLANGAPSVWRASMMMLVVLVVHKWKIRFSITDIISLVFIGFILADPLIVYHIGFQLSFLVTFALLLSEKLLRQNSSPVFKALFISFVSQMVIVPLQFHYFSSFQPLSILLNLIVVPYFTLFVIPFMFLLLFVSPFGLLRVGMDTFFQLIHERFISLINLIDEHLNMAFIMGSWPLWAVVIYYGMFILMMRSMDLMKQKAAMWQGCIIVLVIAVMKLQPYLSPEGSVTMLDVGQGDAFVVDLPYRKGVFLYDAGAKVSFKDWQPTDRVYEQVIKPYLHAKGIQSIDAVFLSHEDMDHMGSVSFLLEEFDVGKIVTSEYYKHDRDIFDEWVSHSVPVIQLAQGESISIGGQQLLALSPGYDKKSPNENSLALYADFGPGRFLFTGDMGKQSEMDIKRDFPDLDIDIHQAGHHGSDTSTDEEFIRFAEPLHAFISVGRMNQYGHPTPRVIEVLENAGTDIWRTDIDGAITFRFDKGSDSGYIEAFLD